MEIIDLKSIDPFSIDKNRSWKIKDKRFIALNEFKDYEIDLYEFSSSAQILHWLAHMHGKNWINETRMYDLFEIIDDIFDLEGMGFTELTKKQIIQKIKRYFELLKK